VWPFNVKTRNEEPILRVRIGTEQVCSITASELPAEKLPVVELQSRDQALHFVDSNGNARSFDMSSVYDDGARFFHMSVRVGRSFAVQPDGILTTQRNDDPQEAYKGGAKGIRFQPFLLSDTPGGANDLVGRGLFYRGLHFSGTVTPGNVSLMCACDKCQRSFRLQSFHAGFGNVVYFYCSGGPHTLTASSYEKDAPPVLGRADKDSVARFESRLPSCTQCGGTFRYMNPLVCPHCKQPFIDFASHSEDREREYYGNYLYGGSIQHCESPQPGSSAAQPDDPATIRRLSKG
jgi:hypothetical protein